MKGYKQINLQYENELYRRPVNQYESDSSMINKDHFNKFDASRISRFKEVGNCVTWNSWPLSQNVFILMR